MMNIASHQYLGNVESCFLKYPGEVTPGEEPVLSPVSLSAGKDRAVTLIAGTDRLVSRSGGKA